MASFDEIVSKMTEAIKGVREAVLGKDVREFIASGYESVLDAYKQLNTAVDSAASSAEAAKTAITEAIDPTLSVEGKAADAKATGDAVGANTEAIWNLSDNLEILNSSSFEQGTLSQGLEIDRAERIRTKKIYTAPCDMSVTGNNEYKVEIDYYKDGLYSTETEMATGTQYIKKGESFRLVAKKGDGTAIVPRDAENIAFSYDSENDGYFNEISRAKRIETYIETYTPDSTEYRMDTKTSLNYDNRKILFSGGKIGYAVQEGCKYVCIPMEYIGQSVKCTYTDLDGLSDAVKRKIIVFATGGQMGATGEDYLSPDNIKSKYKEVVTFDEATNTAYLLKNRLKSLYPTVTHVFFNFFTDDTFENLAYYGEKSTNQKIEAINKKFDPEVQPYFTDEVSEVIQTLYEESEENCLILNIVTDNHYHPERSRSWPQNVDTMTNVKAVNKGIFCDGVVHLGDMISIWYRTTSGATDEQIFQAIFKYTNEFRKLNNRVFMLGGNHDGKYANTWHQSDWYRLGERHMDNYVNRRANNGDFYYDYPAQKVRCIFLQTPDDDTVGFGYSSGLLSWLKETLLSVQNGWTCILFSHCPNITLTTVSGVNKEMVNKDLFENMINAYNSKSGEFESAHGVVRLMVCGHAHGDYISLPNNANGDNNKLGIPVVLIGANIPTDSNDWGVAPDRKDRTVTQDLWDTLVYYPDQNKCNFVRFGARATENRTRVVDLPI